MATMKIHGQDDIEWLLKKPDTWVPPSGFRAYFDACMKVISTSRYKDSYRRAVKEELQAIIVTKARRCVYEGNVDIEEVVDIASYASLLVMLATNDCFPNSGQTDA